MNGAVVKKTQDTLGKVIKKPPLTEKLLSKPPFRYLHDIFSEVIRTTGFMRGLYEDSEMKSDNVKDKDSKIAFLQKALDVVMLVSGEPLAAKPARIVAGHEPERTNELLQAIARCCLSKLSSEEAVKRVLAGDKLDPRGKASASRSQDKENREGGERPRDREERREIRERSGSREHKDPDRPRDQDSRREHKDPDRPRDQDSRRGDKDPDRPRDQDSRRGDKDPDRPRDQDSRRGDKDRHRDTERSEKPRDRDRTKDRDKDKSRDRERDKDKGREKERERDREKTKERDSHRDREREREKRRDKEKERHKEGEERNRPLEKGDRKARASEETRPKPHPEEPSKTTKPEQAADSPARIPRPSSAKGQRRRPKPGGPEESDSDGDGDAPLAERPLPQENGDSKDTASPPHLAHSRSVPRPSSARPAPPRVRRQDSHTEGTPADRLSSAKPPAAVIMEGRKLSEDEEDDEELFVVEETVPPPPDMPEMEPEPAVELRGDEKHGGLVKKILETKKDFESSPSSPKSKEQGVVSEASRRKERELVTREMERVRASIQTLCRSALPLGKIMDYLQEDVDAMQQELLTWRRHNQEHTLALQQEQRVTDSAVEPLKVELQELEQLIKEQQDRICTVKSNILKNDDKIHKMVTSINFSSQT
ncbi:TRAF3-interacting protein 1 isoform X2 [Hypomesus transpacificus]|uniref:TRAF3-interacting protein 1 isoform X2 n=1 Tax=Hypomesus transpacificus TaxID=137520 RepID=UPI001F087116|nr:TRAF3-interacting protein 1 isoform X2 [Hypomesus transpacificus]